MTVHEVVRPVVETAPAKLNLYLHVVGRRDDGYHDLDSLVAFVDIGDEVEVSPASTLSLRVEGPFAAALGPEPASENLVWRAAVGLADRLGRGPGASIRLIKRLPVASGIGGGSADAAACLRALARLWGVSGDLSLLLDIARPLGSDVPVCVESRTSYFSGRGDHLDQTPALPRAFVVLANPGVPLATPAVFRALRAGFSGPARLLAWPQDASALALALAARRNDLADGARALLPVIAEVLEGLSACTGCLLARLSGSGPTCFAIFGSAQDAISAAAHLERRHPGWWVRSGQFL